MSKFLSEIQAVADTINMAVAKTGGDYTPPAEGPALCRLVGYVETGRHESTFEGQTKIKDCLELTFELVGKRHPPRDVDGVKYPATVRVNLSTSLNSKSSLYKLFQTMNWEGKARHMAELLGKPFCATIEHKTVGGKVYANLKDIRPPRVPVTDPETGEETGSYKAISVPEALGEEMLFLWAAPSKNQWASIYREGTFPARRDDTGKEVSPERSRNVLQEKIQAALNFSGSAIESLLKTDMQPVGTPPARVPPSAAAVDDADEYDADPLAGVGY